jgi:excinuclease UvrABC nuclease subunit
MLQSCTIIIVGQAAQRRRRDMKISWSSFHSTYDERTVKRYVPTEAGIYLLWVKLKEGKKWRCFYVGQARNLEARLLQHLSSKEDNDCLRKKVSDRVCGFKYAKVGRQADRDGIEKYLYDHYKPQCNEVDPGGSPIEVNLP